MIVFILKATCILIDQKANPAPAQEGEAPAPLAGSRLWRLHPRGSLFL